MSRVGVSPTLVRRLPEAGFFAILFILLFWPTWLWMAERFDAHDSFYSHGWLVPFASVWLVWQRRDRLKAVPAAPSLRGLWLLVPSVLIHLAAAYVRLGFVSGFAMIGALWGLVWTCFGPAVAWQLRFPLLFLVFMVPLPSITLIAASFTMKMWAATLATIIVRWMGLSAVQAGSTIHVPGVNIIVDDTCSGLRSLLSLVALSVLWTSLLPVRATVWQRLVLVAASIPIALATNMVRILILIWVAVLYGAKAAEGFIHYGSGMVVFGLAIVLLSIFSSVLVSLQRKPQTS